MVLRSRETAVSFREKSRILFICDVQNLFYAVRQEFGRELRLDYICLLDLVRRRFCPTYLQAVAYVALSSEAVGKVTGFLKRAGYEVVARTSRNCERGRSGTDIDALASMQVVQRLGEFDVLVSASGDGDFAPLYQHVRDAGKRVEVLSFRSSLNWDVLHLVNGVSFLDEEVVFLPGAAVRGVPYATS